MQTLSIYRNQNLVANFPIKGLFGKKEYQVAFRSAMESSPLSPLVYHVPMYEVPYGIEDVSKCHRHHFVGLGGAVGPLEAGRVTPVLSARPRSVILFTPNVHRHLFACDRQSQDQDSACVQ